MGGCETSSTSPCDNDVCDGSHGWREGNYGDCDAESVTKTAWKVARQGRDCGGGASWQVFHPFSQSLERQKKYQKNTWQGCAL
jgi:hypothetical protein